MQNRTFAALPSIFQCLAGTPVSARQHRDTMPHLQPHAANTGLSLWAPTPNPSQQPMREDGAASSVGQERDLRQQNPSRPNGPVPAIGRELAAARHVSWRFDGELPQARRHARRTAV
jgi:hypothetical protein